MVASKKEIQKNKINVKKIATAIFDKTVFAFAYFLTNPVYFRQHGP